MVLIIRNKLQQAFFFTFRVFLNRLLYAAFFTITSYRPSFVFCFTLFTYKSIIFERKIHSPLEGYKFNYSLPAFVTYVSSEVDCLSILIDKQHFDGSSFEFLRCSTFKFIPFMLFKDFYIPVPGYYCNYGLGASFMLVVCDMYSWCFIVNIVKYFRFWGFNIILEISSFRMLQQLVAYKVFRNLFIGFNTRNLFSFRVVNFYSSVCIGGYIYESGLLTLNSLIKVRNLGFRVCLIGGGFANKGFFVA
ncbi:hypothetical protein JS520_00195 [Candidatus Vidania fulgoroideae]|nr:hypothetical protein JS520_00195 [Candidatus Vidania fulgoroideae]